MTYDLRRLTRKKFIERVGRTHRYRLTPAGRKLSVFFTKTYLRVVTPSLAQLDPTLPDDIARRSPLGRAWRNLERTLDDLLADAGIAA